MPEVSRFFGICIVFFFNDHNPPHSTLFTKAAKLYSKFIHYKSPKELYHRVCVVSLSNGPPNINRN
jgi:hypothetical protein